MRTDYVTNVIHGDAASACSVSAVTITLKRLKKTSIQRKHIPNLFCTVSVSFG